MQNNYTLKNLKSWKIAALYGINLIALVMFLFLLDAFEKTITDIALPGFIQYLLGMSGFLLLFSLLPYLIDENFTKYFKHEEYSGDDKALISVSRLVVSILFLIVNAILIIIYLKEGASLEVTSFGSHIISVIIISGSTLATLSIFEKILLKSINYRRFLLRFSPSYISFKILEIGKYIIMFTIVNTVNYLIKKST